jgi:hypothetical protein
VEKRRSTEFRQLFAISHATCCAYGQIQEDPTQDDLTKRKKCGSRQQFMHNNRPSLDDVDRKMNVHLWCKNEWKNQQPESVMH